MTCPYFKQPPEQRRPGNALNVEIPISGSPRCTLKTPSNWTKKVTAARWILSGGDVLVFGHCDLNCPRNAVWFVKRAIDDGLIVQAEHPDFGGTLTVGKYTTACGKKKYAVIPHGCDENLYFEDETSIAVSRSFVYQIGEKDATKAALNALGKECNF